MNTTNTILRQRVLVIDDVVSIHEDFRNFLSPERGTDELAGIETELFGMPGQTPDRLRFEIDSAYQGQEGLQRVEDAMRAGQPYPMAFVDMRMPPGWDGIETISRIWQIDPDLEVVICTAYSDHSWHEIVGRLGETDRMLILKKPFDGIEVRQLALALTTKWRLNRAARVKQDELVRMVDERTREIESANEHLRATNEELRVARDLAMIANRAKSEFLANMSHEIRTPMTAILGFADIISESLNCCMTCPAHAECETRDANNQHMLTIKRNGEYLLCLINDILDLSKIEAGKLAVERIVCSPAHLVAEVGSLIGVRIAAKGVELRIEYAGPMPETIRSDPTRLRQILINLLGNAIKFTETGTVRLITCLAEDDAGKPILEFDVVDTGLGMTEEQSAMVFRPFSQADTSTTRKFGGSGLGLTISKRLAEALGGDVTLVETAPGVGSRFRLTVPTGSLAGVKILENTTDTTTMQPEENPRTREEEGRLNFRILLAEDGPDNQRLISHVLKQAGAEVTVVENGQFAIDATLHAYEKSRPFDVVLMDMQMPVIDGYEATALLRKRGYTGPILALTAHAMPEDRDKCLSAGCDDYIRKPIDRQRLIATIQSHAARQFTAASLPARNA